MRLLDDANRQIAAQSTAAVTVEAGGAVDQIGRIRDDEIAALVNAFEHVAQHRAHIADVVERGVDAAVAQRLGIDVGEDDLGMPAAAQHFGGLQGACSASASDIDDRVRSPGWKVGDGLAQRAREAVGVGPKEYGVGCLGRKSRMREQLPAEAREAHLAAQQAVVGVDLAGLLEQRNDTRRHFDRTKWPAPAEHPLERGRGAGEAIVDTRMAGGGNCRKPIIAGLELSSQS